MKLALGMWLGGVGKPSCFGGGYDFTDAGFPKRFFLSLEGLPQFV